MAIYGRIWERSIWLYIVAQCAIYMMYYSVFLMQYVAFLCNILPYMYCQTWKATIVPEKATAEIGELLTFTLRHGTLS